MSIRGFARPELLIDSAELAARLDDPSLRVVDCDQPDGYRRAHIPGAVALPGHHYLKETEDDPHLMGAVKFEALMSRLGIAVDTEVVAYDTWGGLHASRLWWALGAYGHDRCRVLNGGFNEWFHEQRPLERANVRPPKSRFVAHVRPEWVVLADELARDLGKPGRCLLDVRSDGEWTGENTRGTQRGGRIPGAVHREWLRSLSDDERMIFRDGAEIRRELATLGVTPEQEVVTY